MTKDQTHEAIVELEKAHAQNQKRADAFRVAYDREAEVGDACRLVRQAYRMVKAAEGDLADYIQARDKIAAQAKKLRAAAESIAEIDCEKLWDAIAKALEIGNGKQ